MQKTVVVDIVGLTPALLGDDTPYLRAWFDKHPAAEVRTGLPAVTCSAQATMLTGLRPREHGIVGNGWYYRDACEIHFWKQAAPLVQAPRVWERLRAADERFTCASVCWWFNMYASLDAAVTPRPMYPADGRKVPDVWTKPAALRRNLQRRLGRFPLFQFWGPGASLRSTRWIAKAALEIDAEHDATLTLVYLPHLDYPLQKYGPGHPEIGAWLREIDHEAERLIEHFERRGAAVIVVSEYGISEVTRPVHLNRILREAGWLQVRNEMGRDLLDAGASAAFAVADHQIAHVYLNDPSIKETVRRTLETVDGVGEVLADAGKARYGLDHPRAGDLVVVAAPGAWFTYYYWRDDRRAPDFARTVDIHRKPGYDPAELFFDPAIRFPQARVAAKLAQRAAGFRALLDVIPLDARLVRGSHGRIAADRAVSPLFASNRAFAGEGGRLDDTAIAERIYQTVLKDAGGHPEPTAKAAPKLTA